MSDKHTIAPILLVLALLVGAGGTVQAQGGRRFDERHQQVLDLIDAYRAARAMPEGPRRTSRLEALDRTRDAQQVKHRLERLAARVVDRPTIQRNFRLKQEMARLMADWLEHVEGRDLRAMGLDRVARRASRPGLRPGDEAYRMLDETVGSLWAWFRTDPGAGAPAPPVSSPSPAPPPPADRARGRSMPRAGLVLGSLLAATLGGLGALAWSAHRLRSRRDPVDEAGWTQFLGLLARAMALYGQSLHGIKNQLGVFRRFEGDPDGLREALADPASLAELRTGIDGAIPRVDALLDEARRVPQAAPLVRLLDRGSGLLAGLEGALAPPGPPGGPGLGRSEERAREFQAFAVALCQLASRHTVDLTGIVESARREQPHREAISWEHERGAPTSVFSPDAERARRELVVALSNLLANAGQVGARHVRVESRIAPVDADPAASRAPGRLEIRVRDDGPGVPADLADRLFQAHVTGRPDGTGMGLYTVQNIMRSLGGSARLEPAGASPAGGACFVLELPATPAA